MSDITGCAHKPVCLTYTSHMCSVFVFNHLPKTAALEAVCCQGGQPSNKPPAVAASCLLAEHGAAAAPHPGVHP